MLWIGETCPKVGDLAGQIDTSTSAPDIADTLSAIARRIRPDQSPNLRSLFEMTVTQIASRVDFAEAIIARPRKSERIPDYLTPARRFAKSRLNVGDVDVCRDLMLSDWLGSTRLCASQLLS